MKRVLAPLWACLAGPVLACDLALVLAVDISGSVDPREYAIQRDGLAAALRDDVVAEALVRAQAQVTLVQWTGSSRQRTTIPWRKIETFEAAAALAEEVQTDERIWRNFSTAIGEALAHSRTLFSQVPECQRKVIDVSGDGVSNEGQPPLTLLPDLRRQGITVNGLVIEGSENDLTAYFWENVITGNGAFVITANGFEEYPEAIRRKLIREVAQATSSLPAPATGPTMRVRYTDDRFD